MVQKRSSQPAPATGWARFLPLGLVSACVLAALLLFVFRPWESPFEGTWTLASGGSGAPDPMQVVVRDGRLTAQFPDRNPLAIGAFSFTVILDGREHPWSGESDRKKARQLSSYLAWLEHGTLHMKRRFFQPDGSSQIAETRWQIRGGQLEIVNGDSTTIYRRASWFQ